MIKYSKATVIVKEKCKQLIGNWFFLQEKLFSSPLWYATGSHQFFSFFLIRLILPTSKMAYSWIAITFGKGGFVMYPLLLCSIIVLAIIMERTNALRRRKIMHSKLLEQVRRYWLSGEIEKAISMCQRYDIAISRILKAGLRRSHYGILEIERAIEGAGEHEATILNSNLRGLGVIANLAPMLGLLGTVTGMIKAFNVISESGTGNPSLVASGISEALITTATGLIVGIPTLAIYYYFRGRVDKLIFEMEDASINFIEELSSKGAVYREREGDAV